MTQKQLVRLALKITGIFVLFWGIHAFTIFLSFIFEFKQNLTFLVADFIKLVLFAVGFYLLVFKTEEVINSIYKENLEDQINLEANVIKTVLIVSGVIVCVIACWDIITGLNYLIMIFFKFDKSISFGMLIENLIGPLIELSFGVLLITKRAEIEGWIEKD